jgi:hypothetical protein
MIHGRRRGEDGNGSEEVEADEGSDERGREEGYKGYEGEDSEAELNEMIEREVEILAEEIDHEKGEREEGEGEITGEDEHECEGCPGRILADNGKRRVQSRDDVIGEVAALSELEADDEADF